MRLNLANSFHSAPIQIAYVYILMRLQPSTAGNYFNTFPFPRIQRQNSYTPTSAHTRYTSTLRARQLQEIHACNILQSLRLPPTSRSPQITVCHLLRCGRHGNVRLKLNLATCLIGIKLQ